MSSVSDIKLIRTDFFFFFFFFFVKDFIQHIQLKYKAMSHKKESLKIVLETSLNKVHNKKTADPI